MLNSKKTALAVLAVFVALKFLIAGTLPVTTDEAYYASWAENLDFGYFDHPPLVALWTLPALLFDQSLLGLRAISLLSVLLCLALSYAWYRNFAQTWGSMLILWGSLAGLLYGILVTPDVPLLLFWMLALWAADKALAGKRHYWILAGLATGFGLLSKYTMAVIGLVFLWGLVKKPRELKTAWPYLGGCIAFLVFSLNIAWNQQNDWITFNFQFKHGLDAKRNEMVIAEIPKAQKSPVASLSFRESIAFYDSFWDQLEEPSTWKKLKKQFPIKQAISISEYISGVIGLFGLLSLIFLFAIKQSGIGPVKTMARENPLLAAAALIPFAFFGIFALLGTSEANWAAMACFGAAPFFANQFALTNHRLKVAACCSLALHTLLLALLALHSVWSIIPIPSHKDRLLKETAGFKELAEYFLKNKVQIYADKYQLSAMLNFYAPALQVKQWPGVTRDSEYTFRSSRRIHLGEYQNITSLTLISSDMPAPFLIDFHLEEVKEIAVCRVDHRTVLKIRSAEEPSSCLKPIRRLFAIQYNRVIHL